MADHGDSSKDIPWQNLFPSEFVSKYVQLTTSQKNKLIVGIFPDKYFLDEKSSFLKDHGKSVFENFKITAEATDFLYVLNEMTKKGNELSSQPLFMKEAFKLIQAELSCLGFKLFLDSNVSKEEKQRIMGLLASSSAPPHSFSMYGETFATRIWQNAGYIKGIILMEAIDTYGVLTVIEMIRQLIADPQFESWSDSFFPVLQSIVRPK